MNKVFLIGRLTKDVELRYTKDNTAVGTFTLAVNKPYKNMDGNYDADFINCVVWLKAETLSKYSNKGDLVAVEGRIQTRNYENEDGKKVYITEVVVDRFEFLQSKKSKESNGNIESNPYKDFGETMEISESELPF